MIRQLFPPSGWPFALGLALFLAAPAARAAVPNDPQGRAAVIGQPSSLAVHPVSITLVGPRSRQQVVVSANYANGAVRDVTAVCVRTGARAASANRATNATTSPALMKPLGSGLS